MGVAPFTGSLHPDSLGHDPGPADDATLLRHFVQLVHGPVLEPRHVDALADIDRDTRHGGGDRTGPLPFGWTVDVPAEEPSDLCVPADHGGQFFGLPRPAVAADIMITDVERRMMDEQNCRLVPGAVEGMVQPSLPRNS